MFRKRFSRLARICTGTNSGAGEELLHLEGRLERFVHFWTLTVRHFVHNRCLIRAEALAYTSLLALIPLLAVAVGITSMLLKSQGEDQIYRVIDKFVSNIMPPATITNSSHGVTLDLHPVSSNTSPTAYVSVGTNLIAVTNAPGFITASNPFTFTTITNSPEADRVMTAQKEAAKSIHDYIQNALNSKLGVAGMILFIFIAISMLRRVEETFNDIWGVTEGRKWWRQIPNHFTIIALGSLLLAAASGMSSGYFLHATRYLAETMPVFAGVIRHILPLVVLWLVFTLLYIVVPNTQVKFSAAAIGGLVAGALWHLNNIFAFFYVSRVITNSEIYGKLGLVPVFMLGLYFSWVILLFGGQVAYAYQNRAAYLQDKIADNVNQRGREFVALRIMTLLGQRFQNGLPPAPVIELSAELGVPSRLAHRILRTLAAAHLVTEVAGGENAYLPARPLETINAHDILTALRTGSGRQLLLADTPDLAGIYGDFARIEAAERAASEKISVLALVQHLPAQLTLETPKSGFSKNSTSAKTIDEQQTNTVIAEAEIKSAPIKNPEPEISTETSKAKPLETNITATTAAQVETAPQVSPEEKTARRKTVLPEETDFPL